MCEIQRHRQIDSKHIYMSNTRHSDFVFEDSRTAYSRMQRPDQMQTRALHQRKPNHTFVLQRQRPTNCDISSHLTESDNYYMPARHSDTTDSVQGNTRKQQSNVASVSNSPSPRIQTALENLLSACELLQPRREVFTAGEVIVPMDAAGTDIYFVLQGTCYAYDQGIKIETIHEREFFNELGLFYNIQNPYQYVAATDECQIYKVSRKVIGTFLRESQFAGVLNFFNSRCEQRKLALHRRKARHPGTDSFKDAAGVIRERQRSKMQRQQFECGIVNHSKRHQDLLEYQSNLTRSRSTRSATSDDRGALSVSSDQETFASRAFSETDNYKRELDSSIGERVIQRENPSEADVSVNESHNGPRYAVKPLDLGSERMLLDNMHWQQEREAQHRDLSSVIRDIGVSRGSPSQVRRIRSTSPANYRDSSCLSENDIIGMKSLSLNSIHGGNTWTPQEVVQDMESTCSEPYQVVDHAPSEGYVDHSARSQKCRDRSHVSSSSSIGTYESNDDFQRRYNTSARSLDRAITEKNNCQVSKPIIGRGDSTHGAIRTVSYPSRSSPYARAQSRSISRGDGNSRSSQEKNLEAVSQTQIAQRRLFFANSMQTELISN